MTKASNWLSCAFLYLALFTSSVESRTWTYQNGSSIEGSFVRKEGDYVVIQKFSDFRQISIPLFKLSQKDQDYLRTTRAETAKIRLANPLKEYFPDKLQDANGKEIPTSSLSGKHVGIYFSAKWCGPCRVFTPKLVEFRDRNQNNFEVVFVSSDNSDAAMKNYMKDSEMQWLAMKRGSKEAKDLNSRFEVRGIPSLVILSPKGEVITRNGRGLIDQNPNGSVAIFK
ncbi:MAG: thioredoxin-like domain-containing protein [Verrucomicrobiota bacterium]